MHHLEKTLFLLHGLATAAAGVVLAVSPASIPATVGITLQPAHFLLSYFLSAAELAMAILSIGAARLTDTAAIRLIAGSFVVFHLATALLEIVHLAAADFSPVLAANIAVRLAVAALFGAVWWRRRTNARAPSSSARSASNLPCSVRPAFP